MSGHLRDDLYQSHLRGGSHLRGEWIPAWCPVVDVMTYMEPICEVDRTCGHHGVDTCVVSGHLRDDSV